LTDFLSLYIFFNKSWTLCFYFTFSFIRKAYIDLAQMYATTSKLKLVVTGSVKYVGRSALARRYATSYSDEDDLADLKQFQLEEDDSDVTSMELSAGLTSVQTKDARPFHQIPGPRGLPIIGNMLSYSKLGIYVACSWTV